VFLNVLFALGGGLALLALSATPALFGGELSVPLLVISFGWGVFLAFVALSRVGSAAEVWRRLRSSPRG
jgi:hypothetical protein